MKPSLLPALLPLLLLPPLVPAPRAAARVPGSVPAACGSFPADPTGRPASESSWIQAYIPMRNCHRVLRDRHGEFSSPTYRSNSPINFWCNWTIWAGSRQHIIIYIQGFTTKEDCSKNEDKILFEGVSSLVEDAVVFACWKKETYVFATFAEAVHVVLLKTYLPRCRDTRFRGSYYIFHHEEREPSTGEDLAAGTPAAAHPKQQHVLQSGQTEALGDALSPATSAVPGSLDGPWLPASRHGLGTELRHQGAPCELSAAGLVAPGPCGQAQGTGGDPVGATPTAAPHTRGLSCSMSGDITAGLGRTCGSSRVFSGTPVLGALQEEEPFPRTVRVGLESRQAFLHPALGDPRLNVKPTHVGDVDLAVPSQDSSSGGGESGEEGPDPAVRLGLSTVGLEKTKGPLLSVADGAVSGLAESLMPSLTVQNDMVSGDCSLLLPGRSFPVPLSMTEPVLRTSVLPYTALMSFPALGSFAEGLELEKLLHPTGSWDVPEGQPQLSTQSSCTLWVAPTEPRSAGPHGSYLHLVSMAQGHAPSGASPTLGMEMTLVPARPEADPVCAELGNARVTLAVPLPAEEPEQPGALEPFGVLTPNTNAESFSVPPAQELRAFAKGTEPPVPSAPCGSAGACSPQGGDLVDPLVAPGVRKLVLDGDGAGSGWRAEAAAPAAWAGGESFPTTRDLQQQLPDPRLGMGHPLPEHLVAPSLPPVPVSLPQGPWRPGGGGQHHRRAELGPPWALEYFPVRSCHIVLQGGFGSFYPPPHSDIKTNIWCNWTIWAGPKKHIVVYIQGFQTSDGCGKNQDKMIFQGVLSSVETKVVYACYNRGTAIFAAQAAAVHVVFLSGSKYEHFKGRYYVFRDHATPGSSEMPALAWEVSERDIPSRVTQPPALKDGAHGGEFHPLEDETELERSLRDGKEVVVEPAAARGDAGRSTKLPALGIVEGDAWPEPAWVPTAPSGTTDVPLEAAGSSSRPSEILPSLAPSRSSQWVAAVTRPFPTQMGVMEEPPLKTGVKPSPLYPSLGLTAGGTAMPGDGQEDLFDLASVLASLENDTVLRSQHHPGDVLFEVTAEIKHMDWFPRGGRELNKDLLESMKSHLKRPSTTFVYNHMKSWHWHWCLRRSSPQIQKNLKLSANRVNEIKLKEIRRMDGENLLLTWWLHLRPEERNLSLALRSQLQELLGEPAGAEGPWLVSLLVEDVNECGLGLCGEAADCFNGVGTYLCRCKEGYEDRSPTKSGTLCVPVPRSGFRGFFQQLEVLVGAATSLGLVLLVAVLVLCRATRQRRSRRNPFLEELGAPQEPVAEVVMELSRLEDCLRLEPFQLKVRARPPEWISRASRAFVQQEERL